MSYFGGAWAFATVIAGPLVYVLNEDPASCSNMAALLFVAAAALNVYFFSNINEGDVALSKDEGENTSKRSGAFEAFKGIQHAFCTKFIFFFTLFIP